MLRAVARSSAARGFLSGRKQVKRTVMSASANTIEKAGKMPPQTWQQSMLRIKDPERSLRFYRDALGMTYVDRYDFDDLGFSLYFLESQPKGQQYTLTPGTEEAHHYLWSTNGVTVELTHNHGTEKDENFKVHPGNDDGDSFGHLAVSVDDVYAAAEKLEKQGWEFRKRPDEGRMKGIAFVRDPDGYSVELVQRKPKDDVPEFALAQTMFRVKHPQDTIDFYTKHFGMSLVRKSVHDHFTNFFLATVPSGVNVPDPEGDEARGFVQDLYANCIPVLELTHNHGVEDQEGDYYSGNADPRKGFGHIGFLVDDVYAKCNELKAAGVQFQKEPDGGKMRGLAFARDPNGIWVEIIKRGGYEGGSPFHLPEE